MNNVEPTGIKWMERKFALPLALTALIASYPLLFFLVDEYFATFFLLGLPSALGVAAAWVGIKRWKIDKSPILTKYNLHPQTLAFGAGGPLPGLSWLLVVASQAIHDIQGQCDINDEPEITVFALVFMLLLSGQIFWLLWPLAAMKAIWRNRLRLIKTVDVFERLIIFFGSASLVPGMIVPIYMLADFLDTLVCS